MWSCSIEFSTAAKLHYAECVTSVDDFIYYRPLSVRREIYRAVDIIRFQTYAGQEDRCFLFRAGVGQVCCDDIVDPLISKSAPVVSDITD